MNVCKDNDFKKLNILITGGSKGIGKTIGLNFLKEGHNVICTYNSSHESAQDIKLNGGYIYKLDITNYEECQSFAQNILGQFSKIDVLINNAGILKNGLFHKLDYTSWNNVINTNLTSLYNITHPIINNMLKYEFGRIINISSVYGLKGSKGQSNYCSSKFGVIGFTKCLAIEYGRKNILTNCICPALVNTEMIKDINESVLNKILDQTPINSLIEPIEIFNICKSLIMSNHSNGVIYNLDGGMTSM
jgi:acetoacetyl-CoA reductase